MPELKAIQFGECIDNDIDSSTILKTHDDTSFREDVRSGIKSKIVNLRFFMDRREWV